jgi:hypothetical protein
VTVNQLATEVVQFVAQGVQDVIDAYNVIAARSAAFASGALAQTAGAAANVGSALVSAFTRLPQLVFNAGRAINSFAMQMRGIRMLARYLFIGGGLTLGSLFFGAARNTDELDSLKRSLKDLAEVVGDRLAPYVRALTDLIQKLTAWWASLSMETRNSITHWALITFALAGLAAVVPVLLRGLGSLLMVMSYLLNPFIAIPVAILAGATALLYMAATGDTFAEKMMSMAEMVITAFAAIRAIVRVVSGEIGTLLGSVGKDIGYTISATKKLLSGDFKGWHEDNQKALEVEKGIWKQLTDGQANKRADKIFDEEGKNAQRWAEKAKAGIKGVADFMGQLNAGEGFHPKMKVEFESLQGTFDRLQKAFIESDDTNVFKKIAAAAQAAADEAPKQTALLGDISGKLPLVA